MTTALRPEIDLGDTLLTVARDGAALVPDALTPAFASDLENEARGVAFEAMPEQEGRAYQGGEVFRVSHPSLGEHPAVAALGQELEARVHADGSEIAGCAAWRPNEVYVQRYHAGDLGITAHLDLKRYRYLVAVFTAGGAGPFVICKNREGEALHTWTASTGSLVLLRGPGLDNNENGRPLHSVRGPDRGDRVSVSYRMDTSR